MNRCLLPLLLLASPVFAATPEIQLFTARAQGSLVIGVDGRVLDVELDSTANLGKDVLDNYEARIREWRFEPIVENGQPVKVRGQMQLSLVAAREKGAEAATFGIRHVQFLDPPGTVSSNPGGRLAPPTYPKSALRAGAGAEVGLVLKLDPDGRVLSAAAERVELLGVSPQQGHLATLESQFRRSAERVAMNWTFEGVEGQAIVRLPIRYTPPQISGGWVPTVIRPVTVPDWVQVAQGIEFNAGGLALSTQIKLLTPLDEV